MIGGTSYCSAAKVRGLRQRVTISDCAAAVQLLLFISRVSRITESCPIRIFPSSPYCATRLHCLFSRECYPAPSTVAVLSFLCEGRIFRTSEPSMQSEALAFHAHLGSKKAVFPSFLTMRDHVYAYHPFCESTLHTSCVPTCEPTSTFED